MELTEWMQWYQNICLDMGHDPGEDLRSALVLAELLGAVKQTVGVSHLRQVILGRNVVVVGPALKNGWSDKIAELGDVVVAADSALPILIEGDINVGVVVTDLDGCIEHMDYNSEGHIFVVHAHGDNIQPLLKHVPRLEGPVVGTCQVLPPPPLLNVGGYTDGDRAVLISLAMGASSVKIFGFDNHVVKKEGMTEEAAQRKQKKLEWAQRILESERGRGAPIFYVQEE